MQNHELMTQINHLHLKGDKSSGSSSSAAKNPATCDQCGLTLESLSGLQHHIKSIHGAYSDREHKCDYPGCTKAYITAAALKTHYQVGEVSTQIGVNLVLCLSFFFQSSDRQIERLPRSN